MFQSVRRFTYYCRPGLSSVQHHFRQRCVRINVNYVQNRGKKNDTSLSSLFIPVPIKPNPDDINVGAELTGSLNKADLLKILNKFYQKQEIKTLAMEYGLDNYLLHQAYVSFRRHCLEENLESDLHVVISDILQGAGNVDDIFTYFIRHAKQMFPHLDCMDDLKKISDLRLPANWYPEARAITRKIIFHAGPTNSGKTYHALERFLTAKSGVYCGPLKLLASEVFNKSNERGTDCDLVTGEERKFATNSDTPSSHVSCTVEMTSVKMPYEVAVIDEIQMMRDIGRGWAWTRALLGVMAEEIHVCGEEGAIDLVKSLMSTTGEDVEVRKYRRLTELKVEETALGTLDNVQPGDCIVCFSKNDVYAVSRGIEGRGREVAVIYGGLPPGTKLAQAHKFNDPENSCKVLVATDAIGMGLNLSIRRVIFYSLIKPVVNEKGEKEMDTISVSQALQIAGRAGRYNTQFEQGYVTAFKPSDLVTLKHLLSQPPEPITKAGLHPTADQIELYAYHLPNSTLSNLMDIFVSLSTVDDSMYFMCNTEDFKFLADMIQHVPLPLRARYVFCCAPINKKMPFVCTMFLKFARQYSKNEALTFDWLCRNIGWPFKSPKTIIDLVHLEAVFDVLDLYLWFSYRFMDLFPSANLVRDMQSELDAMIQEGVFQLTRLLKNSEKGASGPSSDPIDEDDFTMNVNKQAYHTRGGLLTSSASSFPNPRPRQLPFSNKQAKNGKKKRRKKKNKDYDGDDDDGWIGNGKRKKNKPKNRKKKLKERYDDGDTGGWHKKGTWKKNKRKKRKIFWSEGKGSDIGRGRLTERLLAQGLLTPNMLQELKREWNQTKSETDDTDPSTTKPRRKRKTK